MDHPLPDAEGPTAPDAMRRIEGAIARIEAAIAARAAEARALEARHEALRGRMVEAVAALDDVLAGRV